MRNKQEVIRICDVNTPGISQSLARQPHLKNRLDGMMTALFILRQNNDTRFPLAAVKHYPVFIWEE